MLAVLVLLLAWVGVWHMDTPAGPHSRSDSETCRVAGELVRLPDLPEASGIAASRRMPGVLWAHNDSGPPVIVALDQQGRTKGRVRLTGANVEDWEDIAVGPCPQGSCVYVADIGDNKGARGRITVYRVTEPALDAAATPPVEAFHATYPDGPHDAEALFVTPAGDVFLVSKGDPGPVALYRVPLHAGSVARLERVGEPLSSRAQSRDRPTGAASSPDGETIAIRSNTWIAFYSRAELTSGRWHAKFRFDLAGIGEPQGEGVALGSDGVVYLAGESGGQSRGGTLARLTCTVPPRP
jgi:hypothetical protein